MLIRCRAGAVKVAAQNDFGDRIRAVMRAPQTGPTLRRFFVNTIFDSTFVILGILIASAFGDSPDLRIIIATIITSSVALGISTGVSVYEAETMEQNLRIREMERAMLHSLEDTNIGRTSQLTTLLIAAVNLVAPLVAGLITLTPFLVLGQEGVRAASLISVGLAFLILFVVGAMMGRSGGRNPWKQGFRMALAGFGAFIICYWIESLL
ncbi:MAG TPA: VIT1/CCC1 transporter family protein [Methanomassiliicoccaceae archaeon]|jgi:predicted membrane protein (TIGR00267 family)|nr:VIT1/CCC1 transporter family protein [Methanomassiliicoccaceae archaeon]